MIEREVTIVNQDGLRGKPATYFVQKAVEFKSLIFQEKDTKRINAKSLMGVLMLGLTKGHTVLLKADGADEQEAIEALDAFIKAGFRE